MERKTIMHKTFLKYTVMLTAAFTLSASAVAQQQSAQAPEAQEPIMHSTYASEPNARQPMAQQPVAPLQSASVQSLRSTGRTHGSVTANPATYNVGIAATNGGSVRPLNAPTKGLPNGGSSSASSLLGTSGTKTAPTAVGNKMITASGIGTAYINDNGQHNGQNHGGKPGNGHGTGVINTPLGDAVLPLLILLLGYAAIRSVRKKSEEA